MNIVVYNFEDASIEEFSNLRNKTDSNIYFALSLTEVKKMLATNKIDAAIIKVMHLSEMPLIKEIIALNCKSQFYLIVQGQTPIRSEFPKKVHIISALNSLSQITKQIYA